MVIFHSYVSLPEGNMNIAVFVKRKMHVHPVKEKYV